eukprot:jgi/Psemu1/251596/estExt_Genewise1Plus.C_310085
MAPPRKSAVGKHIVKIKEEDGSDRILKAGMPDYTRCDNTLITSKYNFFNFLPINIKNQFRRFANMYFLIVGFIMWIGTRYPHLFQSAFSPYTTWGPIALFVSISIFGEAMADKKRHKSDYKTNTFRCIVQSTAIFRPIQRKDIRQGHIIVVKNREMIPADMVLLASSGDRGCAYIETSSIDGETNLKLRVSAKHKTDPAYSKPHETIEEAVRRIAGFSVLGCPNNLLDDQQYVDEHVAELMTEPPDAHINTFTGLLTFPAQQRVSAIDEENLQPSAGNGNGKRELPLGAENLLLRGSILRNTEWAIGLTCFTGTDTKLSQNTIESQAKFSQLDLITNKCVIVMVFVELACIVYLSTAAVVINENNVDRLWCVITKSPWPYLPDLPAPEWSTKGQSWLQYAMTNITLLSYFVPLSMYFTLEVCNFFLMWLISVDPDIYDPTTDTRAEPRSVTYTDLGQIQYVFSDKTGTLTQNVMRFKRCSVDGMVFGKPVAKSSPNEGQDGKVLSNFLPTRQVLVGQVLVSKDGKHLAKTKGMTFNAELFLRVMSLCHTVVDALEKAPDGAPPGFAYQAESPDEGALVSEASKTFGFQVMSRDSTGIRLKSDHPSFNDDDDDNDNIETWSVLAINKFDSTRKRMSILLRSPPQYGGCAMLLCKGADSAMLDPEICSSNSEWETARMLGLESHLGEFASEGLRTLVLGVRFLTDQQCDEWLEVFTAAATAIKGREEKLTEAALAIEKDLHIVGATAIEDKLQVGVPDAIATLGKAGIKLWVLTGDKRETAIEIGYSTRVLTPRMHLTEMADRGEDFKRTVFERLFAVDRDVRKGRLVKHLKKEKRNEVLSGIATPHVEPSGDGPRALVIEGAALKHLQGDHELEELVFNVASQCESVIACRVTPRQKAQLVKLVRHYVVPEPVTLAIGDGANDVGMIHAAHVGIGISGKEGQQAVNASDFSIGQFRFLENLVLYHGRWDFLRTSMVVLYTFYKNAVISGLLVLYNNETLFSGTSIFDQWMMAGFSFVCFFPILSIGMFDRNLEKEYIKKNPEVYKPTQKNEQITPRTLSRWMVICLAHIFILYYGQFPQLTREGGARSTAFSGLMWNKGSVGDGEVSDWQSQGVTIFTSLVLLMGYKVLYESRSLINGKWPAFIGCCNATNGGYKSRLPYTWYGILIGSFGAYGLCLLFYEAMGIFVGISSGSWFTMIQVPAHVFLMSLFNYVLIIVIPIGGIALDIAGKVFSNMFYPSQSQIHIELESREFQALRKGKKQQSKAPNSDVELAC